MAGNQSVGCRLPDNVAEKYVNAADEASMLKSELVRRALRYYAVKNPDGLQAFRRESRLSRSDVRDNGSENGDKNGRQNHVGVGGVGDSENDVNGENGVGRGSVNGENGSVEGIYDPVEDCR